MKISEQVEQPAVSGAEETIIRQTKNWINEVVIGLELCPFAARPVSENRVACSVVNGNDMEQHLHRLADGFTELDQHSEIETSLIIFAQAYKNFDDYLELLELADMLLEDLGYCATYQLASFHPQYLFADSSDDDAGNFSNRSPYPMLHLLRESSIEKAISGYENIEQLPQHNVDRLRKIGYPAMQQILEKILQPQ